MNAPSKVLVIGGSGRVGGSAVRALYKRSTHSIDGKPIPLEITIAGRSEDNFKRAIDRMHKILSSSPPSSDYRNPANKIKFLALDITKDDELDASLQNYDLIIHTAGPFQQLRDPKVMKSALRHGKLYLDVCDDIRLSQICRGEDFQRLARSTNATAIISTGIWPGASSLLAQEVISFAKLKGRSVSADTDTGPIEKVTFSFHTAGSGGAGVTILTATFLLLGEDVLVYRDGRPEYLPAASDLRAFDFGRGFGEKEVVRLNLIECESCFSSGVKNVETFFGTAPAIWNTLFVWMARLTPKNILQSTELMSKFALFSLPMVRLIDNLVGSKNAIRVDVSTTSHETFTALLTHEDLEKCVGDAIASFAVQMLKGLVPVGGIYFPEEVQNDEFRKNILNDVSSDAITYSIFQSR